MKLTLTAEQMRSLPHFFAEIPDPRRSQGRRHRLTTVLAIAAGAILCGMRGYRAISDGPTAWAPRRGSASVAVGKRATTTCQASLSCAMC